MFENLTNRLSRTLRNISCSGRLTEENIKETLREVRMALLEADVALPVVRDFISHVQNSALGHEVNKSLTPGQEFVKIVKNELIDTMGTVHTALNLSVQPPAVVLIAGLQGSGKTTSVAKIGKFLKEKHKKKVLIVSVDIYRPAAIKQLELLAAGAGIDFCPSSIKEKPIDIVSNTIQKATLRFYDVLIIDTAGRLHTDTVMMDEIQQIYSTSKPVETLFVVDAMIGQDAANIARIFNEKLPLTGVILTKVDSDARGGAALSVRHITGKPIKFLGIGEKLDALELFHPDRLVSRILGMGDILSLIEEMENKACPEQSEKLASKIKNGDVFQLTDFLYQLKQMRNIGGMTKMLSRLPGAHQLPDNLKSQISDKVLIHMEAIINSMTLKERANPEIIKGSRKRRIAVGSGTEVYEVNRLLKQFDDMQRMIKKIKKSSMVQMIRDMKGIIIPGVRGRKY